MKFAILCIALLSLTPSHGRILTHVNRASASTSVTTSNGTVTATTKSESSSSADGPVSVSITMKTPSSPSPAASPPTASMPSPMDPPPAVPSVPPIASPPSGGDDHSHLDVYFLVDTTKGMEAAIELLQEDRDDFIAEIYALADEVRVGVGEYKDVKDSPAFKNILPITTNQENAASAILSLNTSGGEATKKEAQLYALETVATDSGIGFDDAEATNIVVWIGDQPGSDPALGSTEASAIAALQMSEIYVVAIDVLRLNAAGQAKRIADATEGVFRIVDLDGSESKTASATVTNGSGSASAIGTGDTVTVSAEAGDESAKASSEEEPALQEVILAAIESLVT